jgi:hypothetical protein
MFERENFSEEDQMELYQAAPILSPRFAMPPVAQVRTFPSFYVQSRAMQMVGEILQCMLM